MLREEGCSHFYLDSQSENVMVRKTVLTHIIFFNLACIKKYLEKSNSQEKIYHNDFMFPEKALRESMANWVLNFV